jgi:hypothetical protein
MRTMITFNDRLAHELPRTHALLTDGHLVVHNAVKRVTLHGSRGLSGHPRPDSDIDLALVLDAQALAEPPNRNRLLREVLETTLNEWKRTTNLDIAAVFDRSGCGLKCLATERYGFEGCPKTKGCLGVYKIQRGFEGLVNPEEVDCSKMQPVLIIWEEEKQNAQQND